MKICVISGGSGNDRLIKGLKKFYPESDIKVLVNAYDAGKSTGVCRQVTDTLGVSDIRKNHIRMYKAMHSNVNQCFVEFYEARYNFTKGNEVAEISEKLASWDLTHLIKYVESFFERPKAKEYDYKDFNVSNIVYAEMYAQHGYELTNKFFTEMLDLDDFVVLNSFDNIFIKGVTESGKIIEEEGDLVEYCNSDDIIVDVEYELHGESYGINPVAINVVMEADLIVISTGTFWSSIYPTLDYLDFYKYINESPAKKIWAINCEPDKDTYGVGSNKFIQFFKNLGLDLTQFTILENADANPILRQENNEFNVIYEHMGNHDGKHEGHTYALIILKIFYDILDIDNYTQLVFDFDDTIWARDYKTNDVSRKYTESNVQLINNLEDWACIVSGNSYSSIAQKLATIYGTDLDRFVVDIWADANARLYNRGKHIDTISDLLINSDTSRFIEELKDRYGISCSKNDPEYVTCLKIKPLTSLEQKILSDYMNDYLLEKCDLHNCVARITGTTTVDVVTHCNNKTAVLNHMALDCSKVLYIGDEVDHGNDKDISTLCGKAIHTSGVAETNAILSIITW